jgi:hypothetical protein
LFEGKERVQASVGIVLLEREGECMISSGDVINDSAFYSFLCFSVHLCFVKPIAFSLELDKLLHLSLTQFTGCIREVNDKATKRIVYLFICGLCMDGVHS